MHAQVAGQPGDAGDRPITKKPTGIKGFDDIAGGGLPERRLTTVIGGPGAGKTVFAVQTLMNRLKASGEPGIFVTFEEPVANIRRNMAGFTWGSGSSSESSLALIDARAPVDAVHSGAFDLTGLLAGLSALKEETGARNIVFDGIDMLLSGLNDERLERQELVRLDQWIRDSDVSALITVKSFGMSDRDQLRSDFLQYITDCVVILESSWTNTTSSRSLRIAKYRGSGFAANPVPYVIGRSGFQVVALRSGRLNYHAFTDRVSSGVPRLDALLAGGYVRGSCILISGSPGTSKSSLSAYFAAAGCEMGETALFVTFDESANQFVANMKSIGLDLAPYIEAGRLTMTALLSGGRSPEEHYIAICDLMDLHRPQRLVIDPLSSLVKAQYPFTEIISENLIDAAKSRGITILCTSLLEQVGGEQEISASRVSTIADSWIHVSYVAYEGERNRALTIVKSRGTGHSNQVRELVLSNSGIDLVDVYAAEGGVRMGSARLQKEAEARRQQAQQEAGYQRVHMELERDLATLKAKALAATQELEWKQREASLLEASEGARAESERKTAKTRLDLRQGDIDTGGRIIRSRAGGGAT
jgi:circadian clock protein KaiC